MRTSSEWTTAWSTRGLTVFPWLFACKSITQMAWVPVWQVFSAGPLDSGCCMEWQCAIAWAEGFGSSCCTHCAPHTVDAAWVRSSTSNSTGRKILLRACFGEKRVTTGLGYSRRVQHRQPANRYQVVTVTCRRTLRFQPLTGGPHLAKNERDVGHPSAV